MPGTGDDRSPITGGDGGTGVTTPEASPPTPPELPRPEAQVLSPAPAVDPQSDAVLVDRRIPVRCLAEAHALGGDVDSVTVEVFDRDGTRVAEERAAPAGEPGQYAVDVLIPAEVESGRISVDCVVLDTEGERGADRVQTLLDLGPDITFERPVEGQSLAGDATAQFAVRVEAAPLGDGGLEQDPRAEVAVVSAKVNSVDVVLERSADDPDLYAASVDLNSPVLFASVTDQAPFQVTAMNRRTPVAASRTSAVTFHIDSAGPEVTIVQPRDLDPVTGEVTVLATVEDALSGVNASSLVLSVAGEVQQAAFVETSDGFTTTFQSLDWLNLKSLTIVVSADDVVGNTGSDERTVRLDHVAPIVDLDPPLVRQAFDQDGVDVCTERFDPVGTDALNDLEVELPESRMFRALVDERGNSSPGDPVVYYSGIDPEQVRLYIQTDTDVPLLLDRDGDGTCDAVNDAPDNGDLAPEPLELEGITPFGRATVRASEDLNLPPTDFPCVGSNPAFDGPGAEPRCDVSELLVALPQSRFDLQAPMLWALDPQGSGLDCDGRYQPVSGAVGWVCFVAAARDRAGNLGFSPPLRGCYNMSCDPATAPSCTQLDCTVADSDRFPDDGFTLLMD